MTAVPWLEARRRGSLYVPNTHRELVMVAQVGLSEDERARCAKVPFGKCLCGKAAISRNIVFRPHVDAEHEIVADADHGHYVIPLLDESDALLGMLVLNLEPGHQPYPDEMNLIEMLARSLSAIVRGRHLRLQSEINRIRWQRAQLEVLHKLVAASEFRDNETGEHIQRMSKYAVVIGKHYGLEPEHLELLEQAAPMHDIGKLGIPDSILQKPGRLTDDEMEVMKGHTLIGGEILSGSHVLLEASRQIAESHHEKWDGTGYPRGLKGKDIPLLGRICAIADVFDALTMERPYKEPWPVAKAVALIESEAGRHFDPELVAAFKEGLDEILMIKELYGSGGGGEEQRKRRMSLEQEVPGWRPEYSVGVDRMDRQHMYLISLIQKITEAAETYDAKAIVETILDMKDYAEIHFADEEAIMERRGYPGLAKHKQVHEWFFRQTEAFLDDLEAAPLAVTVEVVAFLKEWLVNHILKTDGDYAEYFTQQADAETGEPLVAEPV